MATLSEIFAAQRGFAVYYYVVVALEWRRRKLMCFRGKKPLARLSCHFLVVVGRYYYLMKVWYRGGNRKHARDVGEKLIAPSFHTEQDRARRTRFSNPGQKINELHGPFLILGIHHQYNYCIKRNGAMVDADCSRHKISSHCFSLVPQSCLLALINSPLYPPVFASPLIFYVASYGKTRASSKNH